jgi:hypothetical protein
MHRKPARGKASTQRNKDQWINQTLHEPYCRQTQGVNLCYALVASPALDSRRASFFELLETSRVSRDISFEHEIRVFVFNLVPLTQTTRAKERIPHELHPFLSLLDGSSGCLSFCF